MRKLRLLLVILSILFVFSSCGDPTETPGGETETPGGETGENPGGENPGGETDTPGGETETPGGETVEKDDPTPTDGLSLIKDGITSYKFVIGEELNSSLMKSVDDAIKALEAAGVTTERVADSESTVGDCEILIGTVTSRGDKYLIDKHTLGLKGTAIKLVDNKIIIQAGTDDLLNKTLSTFLSDFVGIGKDGTDLKNVTISADKWFTKPQNDYRVTGVTVNSNDLKDYIIVADTKDNNVKVSALDFQSGLYKDTGIWLDIVTLENYDGSAKAVIFKVNESVFDKGGFITHVDGNNLLIECAFPALFQAQISELLTKTIVIAKGEVKFDSSYERVHDIRYVNYSDYGAKGDGLTNDFEAIRNAHLAANETGQTVKAENGKKYYIGLTNGESIPVKTDVIWGSATFIIDDSIISPDMKERTAPIFNLIKDNPVLTLKGDHEVIQAINAKGGMKSTDENCGYAPGFTAMLIPYNSEHKVYIRYGGNANSGSDQHEVIIVDKDGNFDENTPILIDYDKVTSMTVINVEDKPITLSGGIFITKANQAPRVYTAYSRNITIGRSNVTIRGLEHIIEGETDTGAPYGGFINFSNANNLLVENTILQAHKTYKEPGNNDISMGTYDIGGGNFNGMYFKNCTQSNMFYDNGSPRPASDVWGIMGTNYGKNITYDHCTLSRFDAHAGVYNATIINDSHVTMVNLIGGGTARIEDSTIYNSTLITLRDDYGSTWKGDVIVKNVTQVSTSANQYMFRGVWNYHYFGYTTYLPQNIYVEDLTLSKPDCNYFIFNNLTNQAYLEFDYNDPSKRISVGDVDFTKDTITFAGDGVERENPNPTVLTKKITLKNVNPSYKIYISEDSWISANIPLEKINE